MILDAARGSIMQFAWLVEVDSAERIAVNPEYVVALRALDAWPAPVPSKDADSLGPGAIPPLPH